MTGEAVAAVVVTCLICGTFLSLALGLALMAWEDVQESRELRADRRARRERATR